MMQRDLFLIESANLINFFFFTRFDFPTQFEPLRQIEMTMQTEFMTETWSEAVQG